MTQWMLGVATVWFLMTSVFLNVLITSGVTMEDRGNVIIQSTTDAHLTEAALDEHHQMTFSENGNFEVSVDSALVENKERLSIDRTRAPTVRKNRRRKCKCFRRQWRHDHSSRNYSCKSGKLNYPERKKSENTNRTLTLNETLAESSNRTLKSKGSDEMNSTGSWVGTNFRQETILDFQKTSRNGGKIKILVIGDELIEFLNGIVLRGRCEVKTESYAGLTITDARERMKELMADGGAPDTVIIHAGSNDIVTELASATSLVIYRLKMLVDHMKVIKQTAATSTEFAISGILPKNDPFTTFNHKANIINADIGRYAQQNGVKFIDHSRIFWSNGALRRDLYFFDGSLNEDGLRKVEDSLLGDGRCDISVEEGNEDDEKVVEETTRYRKRPTLELKDILPTERKMYDKHLPPKKDGQPTTVYFHVTVLSVDSIDEESMTYVADIFLAQSWQDYRLRLPENMTEGYRILDVGWLKYIWRPDSFFKNAKKVTFHDMSVPNHYLWLYYDKTLLYMAKLTLELSCAMKFEAYPHDTQNCSMMIESLSHTADDLVFLWNITSPLVISEDIELPQLDIVKNSTEDCTLEYSTGNFTCLAVVFNLKRRLGYHLFHTYVPTTLIVVMSWISFWIRPEAIPARVTLGVTSLLTLATQNTQSQSSLPPVSYVKAIDVWMSSCTVFVFMSLMEFAVVNHYMGYTGTNKLMRGYSAEELDKLFRRMNGGVGLRTSSFSAPPRIPNTSCDLDIALAIDRFSRFFFPFSFFVLNLIYWCAYAIPW